VGQHSQDVLMFLDGSIQGYVDNVDTQKNLDRRIAICF
jgi:hypothetical protein